MNTSHLLMTARVKAIQTRIRLRRFSQNETVMTFWEAGKAIAHSEEHVESAQFDVIRSFVSGELFSDGLPSDR